MSTLGYDTVAAMLRAVDPDWQLRSMTAVERGFSRVFRATVTDGGGEARTVYLKATPGHDDGGIPADARLLALLGHRPAVPVPTVLGAVDDHEDLPAPFYVMTAADGDELPYERIGRLPDDVLRTLARQVGVALGTLHGVEGLDSFGHVTSAPDRLLAGDRPAGTVAELAVDGVDTWAAFLDAWIDRELNALADSRFDDLVPAVRAWCDRRRPGIEEPSRPVLGRNDHGLHNLLVNEATGEMRAMLDWAYTLAVTPLFDVEYAVYLFSGAFLAGLPAVRDRRDPVRTALLDGYRTRADPDRVAAVSDREPLYELLAAVRVMHDFHLLDIPTDSEPAAADRLAADVGAILDGR